MKMKNENEKNEDFFYLTKIYFNLYFSETLNFADFKYDFGFFIYCFDQKLQPSKIGLKWAKVIPIELSNVHNALGSISVTFIRKPNCRVSEPSCTQVRNIKINLRPKTVKGQISLILAVKSHLKTPKTKII